MVSNWDVAKKLYRDSTYIIKIVSGAVINNTIKDRSSINGFFRGFFDFNFFLLSAYNRADKLAVGGAPLTKYEGAYLTGVMTGMINICTPIAIEYVVLFNYDKKLGTAALSTQAATNIISGIYEFFRYEKNKLNNPVITPSSSGLEEKVETPAEEKKPEITKPLEVFDPWKVDIDELENIVYGGRER